MAATAAREDRTQERPAARVGRPRRVSMEAITAAAIEIGLERVTLKQVADRLGLSLATLYRQVHSREELVRQAAFRVALARSLPRGAAGVHWSELAARYAESLYESFLREPQLIGELMRGSLGPHAEVDVLEQFIDALRGRGFAADEAAVLFHALGMLAIGAAAGAIGHQAARGAGTPWPQEMRRTLAQRDAAELTEVRAVLPKLLGDAPPEWRHALRALLTGYAAARGETLPSDDGARSRPFKQAADAAATRGA